MEAPGLMHEAAYRWVQDTMRTLPVPRHVLEIGSRDINGSVRPLFGQAEYVGIDTTDGPGVDVVADGTTYRPDTPVDMVVCCEVLEHIENAEALIRNAMRCVALGGHVLLTCASLGRPSHSAVDGGPLRDGEYYRNVTLEDVSMWINAAGGDIVLMEYNSRAHDLYVVAKRAV